MYRKGKHLIIECLGAQSRMGCEALETLLTDAAIAAGATVLKAHFHLFGPEQGVTGVLVLAESHITVHTWPENHYAAFDVFMCGNSRPEVAARIIADSDPASKTFVRVISRGIHALRPEQVSEDSA
jgi:S-adenosylmethionine decarboxylase